MAEKIITGTLVIGFTKTDTSDLGTGSIIMEVDDREDGLNAGKTQFAPGDPIYYLVYLPPGATITQHNCSAGDGRISSAGTGNRAVTEDDIEFTYSREGSLRYYANSLGYSWYGKSLGTPVLQDDKRTVLLPADAEQDVGILRTNYSAGYRAYKLSGVALDVLSVVIGIKARITV